MKIIDWENYFFRTAKDIEDDTWLSRYQQDRNREKLEKLWVIKTKLAWVPAKTYFTIDTNKYISLFETSLQKTWKLDYKKLENKNSKNFETYNKNINNNNINNNILLSNDNNSEAENLKETPLLSVVEDIKEKEKSSAKKEKESFWNVEINEFIEKIKEKCNSLWIMYDKTKEREFSRHILTAREFWENSTKCWMTRTDFSINILIASIKIWYFKWPCNWPMKIYQNYADVYNRTVMKRWSGGWIVHIDV